MNKNKHQNQKREVDKAEDKPWKIYPMEREEAAQEVLYTAPH